MIPYELKSPESTATELDGMLFKLRDAALLRHGQSFRAQPRLMISHVLLAIKDGHGAITIDGVEHSLRPDTVYVCKPGQRFGLESASGNILELYMFRFDIFSETDRSRKRMQMVMEGELRTDRGCLPVPPAVDVGELCGAVHDYWLSSSGLQRFRSSLAFQELLYYILEGHSEYA